MIIRTHCIEIQVHRVVVASWRSEIGVYHHPNIVVRLRRDSSCCWWCPLRTDVRKLSLYFHPCIIRRFSGIGWHTEPVQLFWSRFDKWPKQLTFPMGITHVCNNKNNARIYTFEWPNRFRCTPLGQRFSIHTRRGRTLIGFSRRLV